MEAYDWRVIVVWECQLMKSSFEGTIATIRKQLEDNRLAYSAYMSDRRVRREEWRAEMKRRKLQAEELIGLLNR